jgi:hypothetical protein
MQFNQGTKHQLRTFVGIALAVATGVLGANAASAGFDDVPSEGQFAESISRVQEAGIATGFPDGSFRPTNSLNRQQGAAWLDRASSRVGLDINGGVAIGPTLSAANPSAVTSTVEMTSPAASGGSGWVTIQGGVGGVSTDGASTCPCPIDITVEDEAGTVVGRGRLVALSDPTGAAFVVSPILAVVPIDGGETHSYRIVAELIDTTDTVLVGGAAYASYSPMAEGEPAQAESYPARDPLESMLS